MSFDKTFKFILNRYGYLLASHPRFPQVASEEVRFAQHTLIKGICLMRSSLIMQSSIWTRCSSNTRPSL